LDIDRQLMDIDSDEGYLINPGSVGQPRDGDPRAAYALYNAEAGVVSYCRVAYDVESAQRKIRDGGLPPFLAERLSVGR
jgi:diadenosine tetraphosphatase ApaH/serine/threonine PP2A family protein phosphatase